MLGLWTATGAKRGLYKVFRDQELSTWLFFDAPIHKILYRMKYRRDFGMVEQVAFEGVSFVEGLGWNIDMAVPVLLGRQRYCERGYNQVSSFARPLSLAKEWEISPKAIYMSEGDDFAVQSFGY